MTLLQTIVLGIVQGLTEFLPISSSGHLVVVPYLFGWHLPEQDSFIFNVLVQVATLVAVFAYFRKDIREIAEGMLGGLMVRHPFHTKQARLGWLLVLATIPAVLMGLGLKENVEDAFQSPQATAIFLLVTAILLLVAEFIGRRDRNLDQATWKDALWIGLSQALALFPGISRSGATITGAMTRNLERTEAARFSFLMSIPIMLAAGALETWELFHMPNLLQALPVFLPGFAVAAIVGYLSIRWLLIFLTRKSLYSFALYCAILAFIVLGVSFVQG